MCNRANKLCMCTEWQASSGICSFNNSCRLSCRHTCHFSLSTIREVSASSSLAGVVYTLDIILILKQRSSQMSANSLHIEHIEYMLEIIPDSKMTCVRYDSSDKHSKCVCCRSTIVFLLSIEIERYIGIGYY